MDTLTFVSEIIKVVTWPITVLIIFITLRKPLAHLFMLLDKMKYKDFELEFGNEIRELKEEAKKELPKRQLGSREKSHLSELAKISPRAAILEAWLIVEDAAIGAFDKHKIKLTSADKTSPIRLAQRLAENKILDEQKQQIFNKLRNLRNASAHANDIALDENIALEYIETSLRLAEFLNTK